MSRQELAETVGELQDFLAGYERDATIFYDNDNNVLVVSRDPDDPKDISPLDEIQISSLA